METTNIEIASAFPLMSVEAGKDNVFTGSGASSNDRDVALLPEGPARAVFKGAIR
jgi:hypothetical protein